MVFSSSPSYLHHPSNCHQQQTGNGSSLNPIHPPPQPDGGAGSVRPSSMSDWARLANIPMPETALKCPRCESTNTKFCYFNNYSLTQPRHLCKTCRRYWTRGGALRNVPVGGGCRRNKRRSGSKSSEGGQRQAASSKILGLTTPPPLGQFGHGFSGDVNYGILAPVAGLNELGLQFEGNNLIDPWQLPQFPVFDLSSPPGINYQFHGGDLGFVAGGDRRPLPKLSSSLLTQLEAVKMDERRTMGGVTAPSDEQWNANGAAWLELSGSFSFPSTASNPL